MPISNDSVFWPKVLVCSKCKSLVEEGIWREKKYFYTCPTCETLVSTQDTKWVKNLGEE